MKKIYPALLISAISLSALAFIPRNVKSVSAASAVPTDIDLNDCSEEEIRSYYQGLNSLGAEERQGNNLLKNLKPILKENQNCYSYGSSATTQVWQIYEIIDRDWTLSPAKDIEGYNASTNKITGYTYGKSSSNPGSNPFIHALYVNRNAENKTNAWSDHTQTNYGINQEHVWPKSLGFDDDSKPQGARGDLMHLWAGNGRVNGQYHNNYYYGYVDKNQSYKDAGNDYAYLSGNLLGLSKTFGGTTKVFEPQDSDKGDIARAIFYMVARYNYLSGSDASGIDASNPNLELANNVTSYQDAGYTSSVSQTGKMGILQDLLEWNKLDPVDDFEIHRNNLLFRNYSFNRNPFIDFPDWADYIWGTSANGSYSASPTGSANPATDEISKSTNVPVTPSEDGNKPLDWKMILIIAGISVAVIIVVIIIFASLSKKGKKKVLKTAKKAVKKSTKKSSSKSKKK